MTAASTFESLVAELFSKLGHHKVIQNYEYIGSLGHEFPIDILFGTKGDATIVEVKKYRPTSPPSLDTIEKAFKSAKSLKQETRAEHCLLVITCTLTPPMAAIAEAYPEVEVWDINKLLSEASKFPQLFKEISTTLEVDPDRIAEANLSFGEREAHLEPTTPGKKLSDELLALPKGRSDAYKFEDKCIESLKYLFAHDLAGWFEQSETIDSLQRRDLICRIQSKSEIWQFISNNLNSRYVIFEFKNYSKPITQNEVITTEKYLYPSALRKFAIIISPYGNADSATLAMQGAMREHGKLMLSITTEELSRLLIGKDLGDDPNSYLFDVVDNFLMRLGR